MKIPPLGLGTWDLRGAECVRTVRDALELGYRHVDTAQMYENESEVGRGLGESGVNRTDIFLTTKLWRDNLTRARVSVSLDDSLKKLETSYVDLLLIHWPNDEVALEETLDAMLQAREAGKARAIGVSNFPVALWKRALDLAPVDVNQVEHHPFLGQSALLELSRARGLQLVAYTPIAKGKVADDETLQAIARAHGKSEVQVTLRWLTQRGVVAIPKSSRPERLRQNLEALDFDLTAEEIQAVSGLDRGLRLVAPGWSPDWD